MASAVMSTRNEPYWGENKTYMRNTYNDSNNQRFYYTTTANPNPYLVNAVSNHASFRRNEDEYVTSHGRERDDAVAVTAVSDVQGVGKSNESNELMSANVGYVTFDQADYTREELKELKKRFVSELEQIRSLRRRIETGRFSSRLGSSSVPPSVCQHNISSKAIVDCNTKANQLSNGSQNQYNHQLEVLNAPQKPKQYSQKRLSGNKRNNALAAPKPEVKRPMLDPAMAKLMNSMKKRCVDILGELMRHKHGYIFNKPVDAAKMGLLDYHHIIKNPMDFGTVKFKLRKGEYATPLDFAADVQLTFNNALLYNSEGHVVHVMAKGLLANFNVMFSPMKKRFEDDCRLMNAAEEARQLHRQQSLPPQSALVVENVRPPVPVLTEKKSAPSRARMTPSLSPTRVQPSTPLPADAVKPVLIQEKLARPKARDPNKRTMSYEEKLELGMKLQSLPGERMEQLLSIVKLRTGHLEQDGDEIELDIASMDNETLWELDRFVSNVHKMASKLTRQQQELRLGVLTNPTPELAVDNNLDHQRVLPEFDEQVHKKMETAGDEDVDIGEDIPMSHFPPVEIEREDLDANHSGRSNNSASTSSSSGSFSSGSDSASSSGNDSDADSIQSPYTELKDAPVEVMMV